MRRKPVLNQEDFETKRITINLNPAGQAALDEVHSMLVKRWKLESLPSISLVLQGVIRRYAEEMKNDPTWISDLKAEIKAQGAMPKLSPKQRAAMEQAIHDAQIRRKAWDRSQTI